MSHVDASLEQKQVLEDIDHLGNICGAVEGCVDFEVYQESFDVKSVQVYIQLVTHARHALIETLNSVSIQLKQEHVTCMLDQCEEIQKSLEALVSASGESLQDALDVSAVRCRLGNTMAGIWQKWIVEDAQK